MKNEFRVCDFCWNDDSKIILAKATYMSDDGEIDVCAKHSLDVTAAQIEIQEIEKPELPYW